MSSFSKYVGNGAQTVFAVNQPMPSYSALEVSLDGVPSTTGFTYNRVNATVTFAVAPDDGIVVKLARVTQVEPIHKFATGAAFTARNVDTNFTQESYRVEELQDNVVGVKELEESVLQAAKDAQHALDTLTTDYVTVGTFAAGYNAIQHVKQTLRFSDGHDYGWTGVFPKVVAAGSTPTPLGSGGWVDRSEVNAVVKRFGFVSEMLAHSNINVGDIVETISHTQIGRGGRRYIACNKADIININGRADLTANDYVDGFGVFLSNDIVLIPVGQPSLDSFGGVSDSVTYSSVGTNSSPNMQALIDYCAKTGYKAKIDAGKYYIFGLQQKSYYSSKDATGGANAPGVEFEGDGRAESLLYTNGADFIDVGTVGYIKISKCSIMSDRVRSTSVGAPQGKCFYSSAGSPYVWATLVDVGVHRFQYGVYSPVGSWGSKFINCEFKYCQTGLKIERCYSGLIEKCFFICQTAIDHSVTITDAITLQDNHFALGSYCDVFGGVDTTIRMYLDTVSICGSNYFEAYAALANAAVIMDFKVTQTATGEISGIYLNASRYSPVIRKMSSVAAGVNTKLRFHGNRYLVTGSPLLWEDDGLGTNTPIYIYDEMPCTKAPSNIKAYNLQKVMSRKAGVAIAQGVTTLAATDIIDSTMLSDSGIIQNGNIYLPVGYYTVSVYVRSNSTATITMNLSKSGVVVPFQIATNGSLTTTTTQILSNPFAGEWAITLTNGLSSGSATLSDICISIIPNRVGSTNL